MIEKIETIKALENAGVIAVVRGYSEENAHRIAEASIKGGVKAIELAFTSPNADITIQSLTTDHKNDSEVVVGAGTVLDPETARIAIIAGAKFIVSPSFNKNTAKICNLYQIPYMPGCFTPTEAQTALMYGAEVIKVFPSGIAGKSIISELRGPFPYLKIMPTGGVNLENMSAWFKAGAFVIGVGGALSGAGKNNDYELVTKTASQFHEKYLKIKSREEQ